MFDFFCKTSDGLLIFLIRSNGQTVLSFFPLGTTYRFKFMVELQTCDEYLDFPIMRVTSICYLN